MFDNTATAREGTLESGDEIVGVSGIPVKGKSKVEVAKMIQASKVSSLFCTTLVLKVTLMMGI